MRRLVPIICAVLACSKQPAGVQWLTAPTPATHDALFPIAAGPHAVDCNQCHGATDSFKAFDCTGCHTEAPTAQRHPRVALYEWKSASCLACHPRGTGAISPEAHAQFFPIGAGQSHALGGPAVLQPGAIGCQSCHASTDRTQADCTACHTEASMKRGGASFHASVPDLAAGFAPGAQTSALCLRCHADGSVPVSVSFSTKAARHDTAFSFRVAQGTVHAGQACLTCHSQTRPTATALVAADFKQQTCTACHAPSGTLAQDCDGIHVGLGVVNGASYVKLSNPPVSADSKTCLACHAKGQVENFDHTRWFPIAATDTHALGQTFQVSAPPGPVTLACSTCHQNAAARQDVTCTVCHTATGTNASRSNPVDLTPAHASQLGGSNWRAASGQCLSCHARDFVEPVSAHGAGSAKYVSDAPGVTFLIDATNPGHSVACEQCHVAQAAPDPDLQNPRTNFNLRTCNGCHSEAKDKLVTVHSLIAVSPAVSDTESAPGVAVPGHAKACLACHADGRAAPASVSYSHPWFPVAAGAVHALGAQAVHQPGQVQCASCHTALATDPSQLDCTRCHTQAQMTPAAHAAVPDLVFGAPQATSLLCLQCHADSQVPVAVSFSQTSRKGVHGPANGAVLFDVRPGALHDSARPTACLTCHAVSTTPYPAIPGMQVADFTQQTCTACHLLTGTLHDDLDAVHAGITTPAPGYQPVPSPVTPAYSKTCLVCHAQGQIDPVVAAQNHAFFPLGAGLSHAYGKSVTVAGKSVGVSCSVCHVQAATRQNVDCTGCHLETVNNGAPGPLVPADQSTAHAAQVAGTLWKGTGPVSAGPSARCLSCHAVDARPGGFVAQHGLAGPAAAVFNIRTYPPHFVSCEKCHTATKTDPSLKNPETDFAKASCDACHAASGADSIATQHQGFNAPITVAYNAGAPNNSASCLSCHPNGQAAQNFTHVHFPAGEGDVHSPSVARCADCHADASTYADVANAAKISCTSCHNDSAGSTANQNGFTITQVHSAARAGKDIWDLASPTAPHLDYATNALCLRCHAGNIGGNVAGFSTPLVFRLSAHDSHCSLRGKNLISGDNTHNVNRNADNGVNICFACHAQTVGTGNTPWAADWVAGTPPATPQNCAACHEHQPGQNPAPRVTCQ